MSTVEKQVRTRGTEKRSKYIGLRMTPGEYEAIDARAKRAKMTLTEYMVRSSLGELDDPSSTLERFEMVERRIKALESAANLGGFG